MPHALLAACVIRHSARPTAGGLLATVLRHYLPLPHDTSGCLTPLAAQMVMPPTFEQRPAPCSRHPCATKKSPLSRKKSPLSCKKSPLGHQTSPSQATVKTPTPSSCIVSWSTTIRSSTPTSALSPPSSAWSSRPRRKPRCRKLRRRKRPRLPRRRSRRRSPPQQRLR